MNVFSILVTFIGNLPTLHFTIKVFQSLSKLIFHSLKTSLFPLLPFSIQEKIASLVRNTKSFCKHGASPDKVTRVARSSLSLCGMRGYGIVIQWICCWWMIFSTAKRCSSSQSVPGSHPSRPHLGLVVLICSQLCLNAQTEFGSH